MTVARLYCGMAATEAPSWLTVALVDDAGRLLDVRPISDDPAGYAHLAALLANHSVTASPVAADRFDYLVVQLLAASGRPLAVPTGVNIDEFASAFHDGRSFDESQTPVGQRRAIGLARALQSGALHPTARSPHWDPAEISPILTAHAAVTAGRQAVATVFREVLRELYPAALRAFADPTEHLPLRILDAFPEPSAVNAAQIDYPIDASLIAEITSAGIADAATASAALGALRMAVNESPGRRAPRIYPPTIAETVRQSAAAVRAADAASATLVAAMAECLAATRTSPPPEPPRAAATDGSAYPGFGPTPVPRRAPVSEPSPGYGFGPPEHLPTGHPSGAYPISAQPSTAYPVAVHSDGGPPTSGPPTRSFPTSGSPLPSRAEFATAAGDSTLLAPPTPRPAPSFDPPGAPSGAWPITPPTTPDNDIAAVTASIFAADVGRDPVPSSQPTSSRRTPSPPTPRQPPAGISVRQPHGGPPHAPAPSFEDDPLNAPLEALPGVPDWSSGRANGGRDQPGGSPPGSDGDLLIFSEARSAWFEPAHEPDSLTEPTDNWNIVTDAGWRSAEQASRPSVAGATNVGLPQRVPQANLVPGSAPAPARQRRIVRDPESIKTHTAGYFRGWRRGQEIGGFAIGQRDRAAWEFNREQREREAMMDDQRARSAR